MSTIGVIRHDEDVHNIIKKPKSPILKSPRFKSKRTKSSETKTAEHKLKNSGHATFGYAHYQLDPPWNYLKKGKRFEYKPEPIDKKEFECKLSCSRPPVPKWKFECSKGKSKDFIRENIKWADSLEPKNPAPRSVDSPNGNVQDLRHLIEMIKVRERDEYGKIPKYLCRRKKEWEKECERKKAEEEAIEEYKRKMGIGTRGMGENVYMVDSETRAKLVQGLKENWAELSRQFLGLPVMCDTWPKIKRKMRLENEIDRIEKDVRLVETHPYIYLERSDKRNYREIVAPLNHS